MKPLLLITALLEAGTGLALILLPEMVVWLLLGSTLDTPAALTVARVGGAGLFCLGLACGLARNDTASPAAAGLIVSMALYNAAAVVVLMYANIGLELSGVALWPAVVLHLALLAWCSACLWSLRKAFGD